eukprot:5820442-Amphidinium_carterae.1
MAFYTPNWAEGFQRARRLGTHLWRPMPSRPTLTACKGDSKRDKKYLTSFDICGGIPRATRLPEWIVLYGMPGLHAYASNLLNKATHHRNLFPLF